MAYVNPKSMQEDGRKTYTCILFFKYIAKGKFSGLGTKIKHLRLGRNSGVNALAVNTEESIRTNSFHVSQD